MEGKDDVFDSSDNSSNTSNTCINCPKPSDSRIGHNHPFYYFKEHPKFQCLFGSN